MALKRIYSRSYNPGFIITKVIFIFNIGSLWSTNNRGEPVENAAGKYIVSRKTESRSKRGNSHWKASPRTANLDFNCADVGFFSVRRLNISNHVVELLRLSCHVVGWKLHWGTFWLTSVRDHQVVCRDRSETGLASREFSDSLG